MAAERIWKTLLVLAIVLAGAIVLAQVGVLPAPWSDEEGVVRVVDGEGVEKATIEVEVADTYAERYVGLSEHESLEPGEGMLFVHWRESDRTYVMRDMAFDIDIVFVGGDGEITAIHHARAPEPGENDPALGYSGRAKWVLEVSAGYTNETGIEVGDELEILETT